MGYNVELAVPKFSRELGPVSNFNKSINLHHHMKDHVETGHLAKYDAFRVHRDQAMNLEVWFRIHTNVSNFETASPKIIQTLKIFMISGAIIRDGDRKSWDGRGPMIWDNFSIFRPNCAILTSYIYIRADPRTCLGLSPGCCHVV